MWLHAGREPATAGSFSSVISALQVGGGRPVRGWTHAGLPVQRHAVSGPSVQHGQGLLRGAAHKRPVTGPDVRAPGLQDLQEDLAAVMALQRISPELQLSIYPAHGTQYVRHRDAFPDDGSTADVRRVRCAGRGSCTCGALLEPAAACCR